MRQHVLPRMVCSQSVSASRSVTVRNVAGHYITLTRPQISAAAPAAVSATEAGRAQMMRVEGVQSTHADIMASNGVLHIVDQVLFHNSGFFSSLCPSFSLNDYYIIFIKI